MSYSVSCVWINVWSIVGSVVLTWKFEWVSYCACLVWINVVVWINVRLSVVFYMSWPMSINVQSSVVSSVSWCELAVDWMTYSQCCLVWINVRFSVVLCVCWCELTSLRKLTFDFMCFGLGQLTSNRVSYPFNICVSWCELAFDSVTYSVCLCGLTFDIECRILCVLVWINVVVWINVRFYLSWPLSINVQSNVVSCHCMCVLVWISVR